MFLVLISAFISTTIFTLLFSLLIFYLLLILADSTIKNKSLNIGLLSVSAALIQLNGYGVGFLINFINVYILRKKEGIIKR